MVINHNMLALNTTNALGRTSGVQAKSMEKLSSGLRINRAGDDAAGLAISEKMRAQVRGLEQASRNAQDGISLIQTAEGALNETQSILQRMRELGVQAASDTNVSVDREEIQKEINQLTSEINRIGNSTEFNTMKLMDGSRSSTSRAATSTVRTIAVGGDFTANFAQGISAAGGMTDTNVIQGGSVSLDSGNAELGTMSGTTASTLTVTKGTAGWTVKMELQASGATTITSTETYEFSADADFVYDNHGISFTISTEDFAKFTANDTGLTIDFLDTDVTAGSIATSNDWSYNTGTAAMTLTTAGITVSANVDPEIEGARNIILHQVDATTFVVDIQDSAGTSISKDTFTTSAGSTINYDNHGISFDATVGSASAKMTISLDTKQTQASSIVTDNSLNFQVGANQSQSMSLSLSDMRAEALGISSTTAGVDGEVGFRNAAAVTNGTDNASIEYALDVSSNEAASASITTINDAIEKVSTERSKLGAVQNRLEHTINNLDTSAENLQSAESRIRDVDMAKEMVQLTKTNILQQAAQSMLAQANQAPQGVLSLLR